MMIIDAGDCDDEQQQGEESEEEDQSEDEDEDEDKNIVDDDFSNAFAQGPASFMRLATLLSVGFGVAHNLRALC